MTRSTFDLSSIQDVKSTAAFAKTEVHRRLAKDFDEGEAFLPKLEDGSKYYVGHVFEYSTSASESLGKECQYCFAHAMVLSVVENPSSLDQFFAAEIASYRLNAVVQTTDHVANFYEDEKFKKLLHDLSTGKLCTWDKRLTEFQTLLTDRMNTVESESYPVLRSAWNNAYGKSLIAGGDFVRKNGTRVISFYQSGGLIRFAELWPIAS